MTTFIEWFLEQQKKSRLQARIVPLQQSRSWRVQPDGTIAYDNKAYYEGVVVRYGLPGEEQYENLMLQSTSLRRLRNRPIHGIILLAEYQGKYLVQAKAEGGNVTDGRMVLTTTMQSNWENVEKKDIPYKEFLKLTPVFQFAAPQDAGMFYRKHNEYRLVRLESEPELVNERFRLATLDEIAGLQQRDLVGDHLTQMIGHMHLAGVIR
jgi:hypothetical protein